MDLEFFAKRLKQLKTEVTDTIELNEAGAKPVELDQNRLGRLSRVDAMQGQAMALANSQRYVQLLIEIENAEQRLVSGDFGICIDCDGGIAAARLQVNPVVLYCISCASAREN